jgi:hypothetical protein
MGNTLQKHSTLPYVLKVKACQVMLTKPNQAFTAPSSGTQLVCARCRVDSDIFVHDLWDIWLKQVWHKLIFVIIFVSEIVS